MAAGDTRKVLLENTDGEYLIPYTEVASSNTVGRVKPDGTSTTVDANGVISVASAIQSGAAAGATAVQPSGVGNAEIEIQKNGTKIDSFTTNQSGSKKTINITVPTSAADVSALPASTKYGASITVSLNTTDYKLTTTLKDQDGNTLGTAQVVDFPIESVVVNGSYDSTNQKIVLTLQNGNTIDIPVGALISGLQSEITSSNKLDADLVDDSTSTNKFVTTSDKTTWSGKQDALVSGTNIKTVNSQSLLGSGDIQITGTVDTDDVTISENASNKIQTIGIINKNALPGTVSPLGVWTGTRQQWEQGGSTTWYNWMKQPTKSVDSTTVSGNTWALVYGGGTYTVPLGNTTTVAYSTDGSSWSTATLPISKYWTMAAYGNGTFVAVSGDTIIYSTDGQSWSTATNSNLGTSNSVCFGNGKFVIISWDGKASYSPDGQSWTGVTIPNRYYSSVVYGDGKFVAISQNSGYSLVSTNGIDWAEYSNLATHPYNRIAYGNGVFVATSSEGYFSYSSDGITWTELATRQYSNTWNIAFGSGIFVACNTESLGYILVSSDGINWHQENLPQNFGAKGLTYGDGKFISFSGSGNILTITISSDSVFTAEEIPTLSSQIYSAPNVVSTLTIDSIQSGYMILSDNNNYLYNSDGNQTAYTSIGTLHPDWLCNINNVGVKIGNTSIATNGTDWGNITGTLSNQTDLQTALNGKADNTDFVGSTSSSDGTHGLVPAPTSSDRNSFLRGNGTWSTPYTSGSTDTSSKIFLVGTTSQASAATTYSHDTVFVDTDGRLNSAAPASGANDTTVATTKWVKDQSYSTLTAADLVDAFYPIGSIYIGTTATCPLASIKGTWTLVSSGRVLQGADNDHAAGTTINAGLPNITGTSGFRPSSSSSTWGALVSPGSSSSAFLNTKQGGSSVGTISVSSSTANNYDVMSFDASRSSSIYGGSSTVQPPAYVVNIWERTA